MRLVVIFVCFCLLDLCLAQTPSYLKNDWGFIGGLTGRATVGTYGTRNRTTLVNVPGSRIYGAAWIDENENFWMYGGYGYAENTTAGNLGDVWTYDKTKLLWTWKSGAITIGEVPALPAVQTTSIDIYPSGRERTSFWHDKNNHAVFIFGGQISTDGRYVNDMWKFNYRTLEWTFLGGTYSILEETVSWPSSRFGGATWIDTSNVLWLFGGWGVLPGGASGMMNDLWSYSLATSTWSKVNAANAPAARSTAETFVDPRDGYMYLFGGTTASSVYCRDVQRFNQSTNSWENLQTGGCGYSPPLYGTRGEFAAANVPGARMGGAMFYYAGYLWLFGGYGGRGTPTYYTTTLEDVWAFDFNLRQWVWVSGNSTYTMDVETIYTAIGEYTFAPSIGGREGMAVAVSDRNIYGYGGGRQHPLTTYMYGDLWHGRIYRDECSLQVDDCNELAVCIDQDDGYFCECIAGYTGTGQGSSGCQDLDECTNGSHNCNSHAQCSNTPGNFTCACDNGFTGNGYGPEGCTDIDECALNMHSCVGIAMCDNTVGSYSCTCPQNYVSDGQNGCIPGSNPQGGVQPDGSIIGPASPGEASNVIGIAVGVSIGGAVVVAALVLALLFIRKKKKKRGVKIEEAMKSLDSVDDRFNIPYSELVFKRELGAGSFGKVFFGTWRKAEVALKLATLSTWEDFAKEVKLTITMPPHPNVVQVFGISRDGPHPVLIIEYCDGGSLDKMLYESSTVLSTDQILEIVYGIAKGMYHLHKNNIVHRDLAARNILLSAGRPKISDFGLARVVDGHSQSGQTKSNIGPLRWMAPESLQTSTYSPQSDVWSFAIVVYEIVSRSEPHFDEDPMSVGFRIRDEGLVPTIPDDCDAFLKELMLSCWHSDPSQRPTFDHICESIKSHQNV